MALWMETPGTDEAYSLPRSIVLTRCINARCGESRGRSTAGALDPTRCWSKYRRGADSGPHQSPSSCSRKKMATIHFPVAHAEPTSTPPAVLEEEGPPSGPPKPASGTGRMGNYTFAIYLPTSQPAAIPLLSSSHLSADPTKVTTRTVYQYTFIRTKCQARLTPPSPHPHPHRHRTPRVRAPPPLHPRLQRSARRPRPRPRPPSPSPRHRRRESEAGRCRRAGERTASFSSAP